MSKFKLPKIVMDVGAIMSRKKPEILLGLGIGLGIGSTVLAIKATPKALESIEKKKEEENKEKLTPLETVEATWKHYIPTVASGTASVLFLISSNKELSKRNAALATACQLSATALSEYKEQVIEAVGEVEEKEIQKKVNQKKIDKESVQKVETVFVGKDEVLFYDTSFGQLFSADRETVRQAINNLNYQMLSSEYASLNDFYDELGIRRIDIGDSLGWNISKTGQVDISIDQTVTAPNGKPAIALEYHVAPYYDYWKAH